MFKKSVFSFYFVKCAQVSYNTHGCMSKIRDLFSRMCIVSTRHVNPTKPDCVHFTNYKKKIEKLQFGYCYT